MSENKNSNYSEIKELREDMHKNINEVYSLMTWLAYSLMFTSTFLIVLATKQS